MHDPDELTFRRGVVLATLVGFPFLVLGVGLIIDEFAWGANHQGGGIISAAIGGFVMFLRVGTTLNRRERTATTWWGLLVPFIRKTRPLAGNWIYVTAEDRGKNEDRYDTCIFYVVRLTSGYDRPLSEHRRYGKARADAERAAKFLNFGIDDSTSGQTVRRVAGTLNESLRQRLERKRSVPAMPQKPQGCRALERVEGDEIVFELPPANRAKGLLVGALMLVPVVSFVLYMGSKGMHSRASYSGPKSSDVEDFYLIITLLGGLLALLALPGLRFLTMRETVTVSPRGLRLKRSWLLGSSTKEIPADDLEELPFSRHYRESEEKLDGPIVARSDELSLEFGTRLTDDERRWLRDVIFYLVTAPEGSK